MDYHLIDALGTSTFKYEDTIRILIERIKISQDKLQLT